MVPQCTCQLSVPCFSVREPYVHLPIKTTTECRVQLPRHIGGGYDGGLMRVDPLHAEEELRLDTPGSLRLPTRSPSTTEGINLVEKYNGTGG